MAGKYGALSTEAFKVVTSQLLRNFNSRDQLDLTWLQNALLTSDNPTNVQVSRTIT